MTPKNVVEAVEQLTQEGYRDIFRAEGCGMKAASQAQCCHPPEEVQIERLYRFEGDSQPDEQTMVMGLRCLPDGNAGTYVIPHGPKLSRLDADALSRLKDIRPR